MTFHAEHSSDLPFHCSKCGAAHARYRDHARKRPASYCRACHAAHMRDTRPPVALLSPQAQRRHFVRAKSRELVLRGILHRQACSKCGSPESEIHHPDYSKPWRVDWMCRKCHLEHHRQHSRVDLSVSEAPRNCANCGAAHTRYRDRRHRVPASYCRICHATQMRAYRMKRAKQADPLLPCRCRHPPGYHARYYWATVERCRLKARERRQRHYWAVWLIREVCQEFGPLSGQGMAYEDVAPARSSCSSRAWPGKAHSRRHEQARN